MTNPQSVIDSVRAPSTVSSFARWLLVGVGSMLVVFGVTLGLTEWLGINSKISYAVALVTAFAANFAGLRYYVYGRPSRPFLTQLFGFAGASIAFRGLEYLSFLLLVGVAGVHYAICMVVVQTASAVAKFLLYRSFLFGLRPGAPAHTQSASRVVVQLHAGYVPGPDAVVGPGNRP